MSKIAQCGAWYLDFIYMTNIVPLFVMASALFILVCSKALYILQHEIEICRINTSAPNWDNGSSTTCFNIDEMV